MGMDCLIGSLHNLGDSNASTHIIVWLDFMLQAAFFIFSQLPECLLWHLPWHHQGTNLDKLIRISLLWVNTDCRIGSQTDLGASCAPLTSLFG
jgi:hypothetical protein